MERQVRPARFRAEHRGGGGGRAGDRSEVNGLELTGFSGDQSDDEGHKEEKEADLGDGARESGNAAKSQDAGEEGDDEKGECPVEHGWFKVACPWLGKGAFPPPILHLHALCQGAAERRFAVKRLPASSNCSTTSRTRDRCYMTLTSL